MRLIKLFLIAFTVFIVWQLWTDDAPPAPQAAKPPPTAAEKASDERFEKITAYGSALKNNLREPNSVEWVSILANDDASVACFEYKAKNGFGGVGLEQIVVFKGIALSSSADWNKHCAGKKLFDLLFARRAIR